MHVDWFILLYSHYKATKFQWKLTDARGQLKENETPKG